MSAPLLSRAPIRHRRQAPGRRLRLRRGRGAPAHLRRRDTCRTGRDGRAASRRPAARTRPRLGGVLRPAGRGRARRLRPPAPHRVPRPPGVSRRSPAATPARSTGPRAPVVIVDLCCGSGAVGAALLAALGSVELHAVDIDAAAVRCARRNVAPAGGRVYQGDLYQPLPPALRGRVDVLVANAPYVPTESVALLPPEARLHEPRSSARRWRGRARRAAPGDRRGARVARAGRAPAGRDQSGAGAAGRRDDRRTGADPARGRIRRPGRHGRHRDPGWRRGYQTSPPRQSQDRSSCARSAATGNT